MLHRIGFDFAVAHHRYDFFKTDEAFLIKLRRSFAQLVLERRINRSGLDLRNHFVY
jgi:hypothetical protein